MREMHSKRPKFSKFSGGACPRTPLEARALRRSLKTPSASFSISPPTSQILPSTPFLIENPALWRSTLALSIEPEDIHLISAYSTSPPGFTSKFSWSLKKYDTDRYLRKTPLSLSRDVLFSHKTSIHYTPWQKMTSYISPKATFTDKETWTHNFCVSARQEQNMTPSRAMLNRRLDTGLGKMHFSV